MADYIYNTKEVRCIDCDEVLLTFCPPLNDDEELSDDIHLILETSGHECWL